MNTLLLGVSVLAALLGLGILGTGLDGLRRSRARCQRLQNELERSKAEIRTREHELHVLLRSVQEPIFRTDAEGRVIYLNDRWLTVVGEPARRALGRPLLNLVPPACRSDFAPLLDARMGAARRKGRFRVQSEDGPVRHFDVSVVPWYAGPEIAGYSGSAVDVTERVEIEQRLSAQRDFSNLLLEISPLPISLVDEEDRYITVNQAWESFRGLQRDEVIQRSTASLLDAGQIPLHQQQREAMLRSGQRVRYEARIPDAQGVERDVVITRVLVPKGDGHPAGILTALTDVTEFRDAERHIREARDVAEEASRAKSEFVANISHELRTPLQSILGFSELGTLRAQEQPRLAAMFADVHAAGQRMLALVNDLLDVSKIECTVGTFHLERLDIRRPVRAVAAELAPLLGAKRLHLDLALGEFPLSAKVDPLRLQQAVRNVLANAIKFSPEQGRLEVGGDLSVQGDILLWVRDHGPGIPEAELETIFDAFVQSSQTKDGSGGTGLGLAISRKIMQAHGGTITARNMPDGGCQFELCLPSRGFSDTLSGDLALLDTSPALLD